MYQGSISGVAIASALMTLATGQTANSLFIGSSCFLPDSVRGMTGAANSRAGQNRGDRLPRLAAAPAATSAASKMGTSAGKRNKTPLADPSRLVTRTVGKRGDRVG